ncbi:MAG: hypothetical protein ACK46X_18255 [Candidatus Sericytochromatia bacterium]
MAGHVVWREVRNADLTPELDVGDWFAGALARIGQTDGVGLLTSRDISCFVLTEAEVVGQRVAVQGGLVGLEAAGEVDRVADRPRARPAQGQPAGQGGDRRDGAAGRVGEAGADGRVAVVAAEPVELVGVDGRGGLRRLGREGGAGCRGAAGRQQEQVQDALKARRVGIGGAAHHDEGVGGADFHQPRAAGAAGRLEGCAELGAGEVDGHLEGGAGDDLDRLGAGGQAGVRGRQRQVPGAGRDVVDQDRAAVRDDDRARGGVGHGHQVGRAGRHVGGAQLDLAGVAREAGDGRGEGAVGGVDGLGDRPRVEQPEVRQARLAQVAHERVARRGPVDAAEHLGLFLPVEREQAGGDLAEGRGGRRDGERVGARRDGAGGAGDGACDRLVGVVEALQADDAVVADGHERQGDQAGAGAAQPDELGVGLGEVRPVDGDHDPVVALDVLHRARGQLEAQREVGRLRRDGQAGGWDDGRAGRQGQQRRQTEAPATHGGPPGGRRVMAIVPGGRAW